MDGPKADELKAALDEVEADLDEVQAGSLSAAGYDRLQTRATAPSG